MAAYMTKMIYFVHLGEIVIKKKKRWIPVIVKHIFLFPVQVCVYGWVRACVCACMRSR